ncbi:hypothetical protein SAMN05216548_1052 [Faunimonas pinastri]|uniref:Uncharacterized protein n=1 Tax=Faunimonas pinastri TaxID=1855383 RepID=A0A1H9GD31_9HYPH|nr:hypothetical protein [Faunimonas pinastri]SEQ47969.1 hypothetical protein SAMN05216548_1052 [Faunimonas pinastri]
MTTSGAPDLDAITVANNADWPPESFAVTGTDGVAVDFTAGTVRMQLRKTADAATAYLDLQSPADGIAIATDGTSFTIAPNATLMSGVPAGSYIRDVLFVRDTETIFIGRGDVTVVQGITR